MMNRLIYIVFYLCFACFSTQVLADKTDIIILQNGDHITGEIKNLVAGQLELSTEYMGTVFIDWENIRDIISDQGQHIEMTDGRRLTGTLNKPQTDNPEDADLLIINTGEGPLEVTSANLVRMYPIGGKFWDRLDLAVSLGFNYDKNSSVGKYNLGIEAVYRATDYISIGRLSSDITTQTETDNTKRNVLNLDHLIYKPNKKYHSYFGSMEQNDQLGVKLRTLLGLGYGWVPIATGRNMLTLGGGLAANWERPRDDSDATTNLEAVGTIRYQYYKRSTPERTLDTHLKIFPSITQWGRVRADFTVNAQWEIIRDFFVGMEFYTSYDGEPTAEVAAHIDWGIRTVIGLKF